MHLQHASILVLCFVHIKGNQIRMKKFHMLSYGLLFKLTYKKEEDELHTGDPFGITVCGLGSIMRYMKCSKAMD